MKRRARSEGALYRRSDGLWAGAVEVGVVAGKRRRRVVYGRTQSEVQRELRRVREAVQGGLLASSDRTTISEFLRQWLEDVVSPRVRERTLRSYREVVDLHLTPGLGSIRLSTLSPSQVQSFLRAQSRRGLSPRTVQYHRSVLRNALRTALQWRLVPINAAALADGPRVPMSEVGRTLSPDEARSFLDATRTDRFHALYVVALALGLRQGEALGLNWQDIDFDARQLYVAHALQRVSGALVLVEPKSRTSRRVIPMPDVVTAALEEHAARQSAQEAAAGSRWAGSGFVFTTNTGAPLDARQVVRSFKKALGAAGLPAIRFHDLRHSCASLMLTEGVPMRVVQETLGHSDIRLTMGRYTHVLPAMQREAADGMDRVLLRIEPGRRG